MPTARRQKPEAAPTTALHQAAIREEAARLRTLRDYAILDTPPEAAFERIARLAARLLSMPIAMVSFLDEHRQWFKAECGLNIHETPREISFCQYTILRNEVLVVPDAMLDARFTTNPLVTDRPALRFYAGAPLRAPNGQNLGTLCVADVRPRHLEPVDIQTLRELAATVVDELELRRVAADLREEIAQRERAERDLAEALRSVESQVQARTAELSHRNEELRCEIGTRREAEAAWRASELQFRELAENIKQVFWMYNADASQLLYVSPAYEKIWGRPLDGHGRLIERWIDTVHPEDRARVTDDFSARAAGDRYEEEYRVLRPDGADCWVHDRAFAIRDAAGSVYRIAGIATDITERKRQEALVALRARQQQTVAELGELALKGGEIKELLAEACRIVQDTLKTDFCGVGEHLPDRQVFVLRAMVGLPTDVLPGLEVPGGHASASGYVMMTGEPLVIGDAQTETRFEVSRWSRGHGARSGMVVLIGGDGTRLPAYGTFNVFSRTLRTFSPDDIFFLQGVANVLAAAISRRRGEEALRIAKEEAELANSAKSSFLSRMSHELRTPLNAILGFSQLLQMDVATERQQECVKHVLVGGRQLLAMIDDVLDISRLELGRGTLTVEAVPARDAIALSIDLIRPLAAPRAVVVTLEGNPAVDRTLLVNRQRLNQILLNLLTNAVKYNRPGGRVTVSCREMPSARLRIDITDTGPGIASEDFARLFVPFDRLGAERSDVPGTGLGLALCKNLVEAQGGQIGVESTVGQGSTFWIQLPLAAPAPALAPADPVATVVPSGSRHPPCPPTRRITRQRTRTILYVEDNLSNLRLIERLLQRRPGIRLLTATLGRKGLELARRRRPDLVLLDAHLPDLSGREVLDALQGDPATRPIPVVIVSADALPANIEAMRAAGARRYVTKPLDIHQLVEMLAELA